MTCWDSTASERHYLCFSKSESACLCESQCSQVTRIEERSDGRPRGTLVVRTCLKNNMATWKCTVSWTRCETDSVHLQFTDSKLFVSVRACANYLCEMGLPAFPISSSLKPRYFSSRRSSTLFSREHEKFHFINSLKRRINSEVCGWKLEIYSRATPNVCDQWLWI